MEGVRHVDAVPPFVEGDHSTKKVDQSRQDAHPRGQKVQVAARPRIGTSSTNGSSKSIREGPPTAPVWIQVSALSSCSSVESRFCWRSRVWAVRQGFEPYGRVFLTW
jgi:hypothetical protein